MLGEASSERNRTLDDLIPRGEERLLGMLATSFIDSPDFVKERFSGIPSGLFIVNDSSKSAHKIGAAVPWPESECEAEAKTNGQVWLRITPTGNIQHSKLTMFRTENWLRVIVAGSNLCA